MAGLQPEGVLAYAPAADPPGRRAKAVASKGNDRPAAKASKPAAARVVSGVPWVSVHASADNQGSDRNGAPGRQSGHRRQVHILVRNRRRRQARLCPQELPEGDRGGSPPRCRRVGLWKPLSKELELSSAALAVRASADRVSFPVPGDRRYRARPEPDIAALPPRRVSSRQVAANHRRAGPMTDLTAQAAAFVSGLRYAHLPAAASEIVARGIIDCVGVMILGFDQPVTRTRRKARGANRHRGGLGPLGQGARAGRCRGADQRHRSPCARLRRRRPRRPPERGPRAGHPRRRGRDRRKRRAAGHRLCRRIRGLGRSDRAGSGSAITPRDFIRQPSSAASPPPLPQHPSGP